MSKKKQIKKNTKENISYDVFFNPLFNSTLKKFLIFIPLLWGLILTVIYLYKTYSAIGAFGFPLDDPWIHLTFARNVIDYGSFSYFKNEIVTSGSTSPIYTLLAALLFVFTSNEFILSYCIGILFFLASIFFIYKNSEIAFSKETIVAVIPALFLAVNPKMVLISVSGMETTLFVFLLLLSVYFYFKENYLALGISLGLLLWARPDGIVMWIAVLIDFLIKNIFAKYTLNKKTLLKFFIPIFLLTLAYCIFNFFLSGSILPNTFNAKISYYAQLEASTFLKNEVFKEFSAGNYILLFIPFFIGLLFVILDNIKKQYNPVTLFYLFILGLIAVYYIKLPFAHRFGRYLIPVIPFYIMASIYGIRRMIYFINQFDKSLLVKYLNYFTIAFSVVVSVLFMFDNFTPSKGNPSYVNQYSSLCEYHNIRHKKTGEWLKENTPENAIIATHDIGAIAFYSQRKIIDMVGLVSPEVIDHLQSNDFHIYINSFIRNNNVNYLAVLKNWFEVVNDRPVFVATKEPEILEVYKYKPGQTHITANIASQINSQAGKFINGKNFSGAINLLNQSLQYDTLSARTYMLFAVTYQLMGNKALEEINWIKAISLFPGYYEAEFELAKLYFDKQTYDRSKIHLMNILKVNPEYKPAIDLLKQIPV